MSRVALELAGKTDPGCVRDRNEDSLVLAPDIGLAVVADGMGGHNAGEVASNLATQTILEQARMTLARGAPPPEKPAEGPSPMGREIERCIRKANAAIYARAQSVAKQRGMGTTVVAALAGDGAIAVAHVGDSRLYLWRKGELQALTEDHSLVMDQVRHGLITREQAEKSNFHNILTRALGTEQTVSVDVQEHPVFPGDVLLLCSDGLTKMVKDEEIADVLAAVPDCDRAVERLVDDARRSGGLDNITVVVAKVLEAKPGWLDRIVGILGSRKP